MTKITYIPGEIANAAIDEHGNRKPVTRTHHIFDDAKGKNQQDINEDIYTQIQSVKGGREKSKGYYDSFQSLTQDISSPEIGDWAIVKNEFDNHWHICRCVIEGQWEEIESDQSPSKDSIKHIFMTQSAYDALETYEEDTLYLIIEHTSGGSRLGEDTFPLILG